MIEIERRYPYSCRHLLNGVYDLTDGAGGSAHRLPEQDAILGRREVYGKESGFLFAVSGDEKSSVLRIGVYEPATGLSRAGELRALNFLFDSLDQLIEDELYPRSDPKHG